jgi:hypothetical protein
MLVIWKLPSVYNDWSETSNRDLHRHFLGSLHRYQARAVYQECQTKYGDLLGPDVPCCILCTVCRHLTINDASAPVNKELEERML